MGACGGVGSSWWRLSVVLLASGTASGRGRTATARRQYWLGHQLPSGRLPGHPRDDTRAALRQHVHGARDGAPAPRPLGRRGGVSTGSTTRRRRPRTRRSTRSRRCARGALLGRGRAARWDPVLRARMDHVAKLLADRQYVNNWSLVAAAAAIEADRAGIGHYRARGARYPEDAATCRRCGAATAAIRARGRSPTTRSGSPGWRTSPRSRATPSCSRRRVDGCRILVRLVSPMGRVAWYGRSYEESFAQAAAVYALRRCERWNRANAGRYERTAVAALAMLRREHPTILGPLAIVPRMRFAQTIARDGTDNYAQLEVYNALTLALLAMAPPPLVAPAAPPPADRARADLARRAPAARRSSRSARPRRSSALSLRRAPGAARRPVELRRPPRRAGPHAARAGDDRRRVPTTSTCRPRPRVRTDGRAVLARGPGYALRIRVDGCTVVELLRLSRARRVTVGGRAAAREGRGGRRHRPRLARPAAASSGSAARSRGSRRRVEAGSDRYRTAVLRARVALPAGTTLQVERGVALLIRNTRGGCGSRR